MDILRQRNNSKYRLELIKKVTPEELIFFNYLTTKNIKFNFQKGFLKPYHRICDFYIKKYRLRIEIDGGYHNTCKAKDDLKDKTWGRFRTLRILNEDIHNGKYVSIFENFISLK